ncbi:hypothetical protein B0H17DRAFT_953371, partial [Mycena rosella]
IQSLPDFHFNFEGAVLGVLEPLEEGHNSASLGLPFIHFIATRYLPCGPSDKPIQKFTGNLDCGAAPGPHNALTMAIHSFTHFFIVYTGEAPVFCDLQGSVLLPVSFKSSLTHFQACVIVKEL